MRKKDLNPVWVESFELPNADKDQKVVFEVLDYDAYGTSDPIGRFALPFLALSDRKLMRRWFVLKDQAGQKTGGKCEVALKWHVPASRCLGTMFSAQTRTRPPRDTLDPVWRGTPHPDHNKPQIEGRLKFEFLTGRYHSTNGCTHCITTLPVRHK